MNTVWFLAQPLVLISVFGIWVYCIQDTLRCHRAWTWVLLLLFVPPVGVLLYFVNLLGGEDARGRGSLDRFLGNHFELRHLERKAAEVGTQATYRDIADLHFCSGDYERAVGALTRALDMEPEDLRSQFQAGVSLVALGRSSEALPHLEYVLHEDPKYQYGETYLALANAHLELGAKEEAGAILARTSRQFNLPEASVKHARMLIERGEAGEA
ncbi:tetratricopeptide repeat protein, partial [Candidatus Poribacteria bacterium]|nr:tetratricopeptide repeat protein [Candidatus Poribacteria bacterium]